MLQQTATFVTAVVQHVAHGFPRAANDEHERRLAICQQCVHFVPAKTKCRACGCHGLKLWMADMQCPIGKW